MTNSPRITRRPRRALAAISAVLLGAAVLAAATSSPVQAANTASEALVDTDNDGVGDAREFGGRDRYDTALRLAANFGKSRGLGNVAEAFVASGESLVDAVAVSGLAGHLDAPVVLTRKGSLPAGVADFLEDYGVGTVHVLGGPDAVSDSVVEALRALDHKPTVARIQGADRYSTAAEIATALSGGTGGGNAWCGGTDNAAILVNGGDVSLAYAMLVGPMASRLQLPVLLTAHDELPAATRDAISDQDYEHVVIVGGTSSVSASVTADLTSAGVDTITRIDGNTPADASARLAALATDGCRADLGAVADTTVALVSEGGLPDGVAASPVLASSYRSGELVPMLVVGDSLPASVSDFLAATPQEDALGNKLHMQIVAIGGPAAVTPGAMTAAIGAAASAPALTVSIVSPNDWDNNGKMDDAPRAGETSFDLRFSDDITGDTTADSTATTQLRARLLDVLRIGGVPAVLAEQTDTPAGVVFGGGTTVCDPDKVTVNLASALIAGQQIVIPDTTLEFGAQADRRPLRRSSVSVARKETRAPTFEFISIVGQSSFTVIAKDNLNTDTGLANGETLIDAEITATSSADDLTVSSVGGGAVDTSSGRVTEHTFTVNVSRALLSTDRITIAKDAIKDAAGNGHAARTSRAPLTATSNVRLLTLRVSGHYHDVQARYTVPAAITGGNSAEGAAEDVFFTAKPTGRAAGANGNGWRFDFRQASTYNEKKPVSIEVLMNTAGKRAFITFVNGKPRFADLAAALRAHNEFNGLWDVSFDPIPNTCVPANKALTVGTHVTLEGDSATSADKDRDGTTKMAIEATFSGYVASVTTSELLADVFAPTVVRIPAATLADIGLSTAGDVTGPVRTVRYVASTQDVTRLPRSGDRINVEAGTIATGYVLADGTAPQNSAQENFGIGSGAAIPR